MCAKKWFAVPVLDAQRHTTPFIQRARSHFSAGSEFDLICLRRLHLRLSIGRLIHTERARRAGDHAL